MSSPAPCLSVLILTEDAGTQGYPCVVALTRAMLQLVDPVCDLSRIRFEPLPVEETTLRHLVRANRWKSSAPEDRRHIVALRRRIATKLLERDPPGFVVFHVDADRPWQARYTSENAEKFERIIAAKVDEQLESAPRSRLPVDERQRRKARLLRLLPCYAIEAWLYQNIDQAIAILWARYGGSHVFQLEAWRADRAALDELAQPKTALPLGGQHNQQLAEQDFPAAEVAALGKSFGEAAMRMKACDDLVTALACTRTGG